MKIILGSASKWRRELLKEAGFNFEIMHADIDERIYQHEDIAKLVITIAKAKAVALMLRIQEDVILITVDQTVVCNGHIHNKPENPMEAKLFLHRYADHPAITYTGIVITNTKTKNQVVAVDIAKVYFKPIPEIIMDKAIEQGQIFHCAGAFQIEGDSIFQPYIERVEGELDSVKGLPIRVVKSLLQQV